jgi:exopolysaccharide biosynthesis polyprenyl glycosylphosphotransferase
VHVRDPVVSLQTAVGAAADEFPLLTTAPDPPVVEAAAPTRQRLLHAVGAAGRASAVLMAVGVPYLAVRPATTEALLAVGALVVIWLVTLRHARAAGQGLLGTAPTVGIGTATGLGGVVALDPWFPGLQLGPLELVAIATGVFASAALWETALRRTSIASRRVLVIGTDGCSAEMADEVRRVGLHGVELVAHVADGEADRPEAEVPLLGGLAELRPIVEAQQPDIVVLTDEQTYGEALDRLLDVPEPHFRAVGLTGFFEHVLGRVPIEQVSPAWFMSILHVRQPVYARWTKRTFDVALAAIGLLLAAPFLLLVGIAVRTTGSPVLYRQTRVGEGGRPFTIYKFRTMVPDAEADGPCFACEGDARTTRCGRFLRRTHLDELPQLWNVLRGEMAIVGPRPERPEFVEVLERTVPFWTRRSLVTPGITGWAQLRCGYASEPCEMEEKLSYDLWYLRHRSLIVDLAICIETIGMQLRALAPRRLVGARRGVGR